MRGRDLPSSGRVLATVPAITFFLLVLQTANCAPVLAEGGTVSCVCYCGISLRPPCGDESCKRACGWKAPSPSGGSPAGAAAGAIGGAISDAITRGFEQSRIRAEQERQENLRIMQQNQEMQRSVDLMSQEEMLKGDELLRRSEEQARRLDEQRRGETLSTLQGIPQSDGLTLMPATDIFGASVVDLRHLDPEKPIRVDNNVLGAAGKENGRFTAAECETRKAARDRLADGLPVQSDAIRRTEAQLEAAQKEVTEAGAEKRQLLLQGAIQEAKGYATDVLTSAKALRSQVEVLNGLDKGKRDLLIRSLNTVIFEGEGLAQAAQAGYEGGDVLRGKVDSLSGQILSLADKLLMQSGIAEKAGEELSEKLGGPLGALAFRGARLSIDFTVAIGKGRIGEAERETAQRNLDTMRGQMQRARQRITELDNDMKEGCI